MKKLLPPFLVFLLCAVLYGEELSPTGEQISPTTEEQMKGYFDGIKNKQREHWTYNQTTFDFDLEKVSRYPLAFFDDFIKGRFIYDPQMEGGSNDDGRQEDPVLISFIDFPVETYTHEDYLDDLYASGRIDDKDAYVEDNSNPVLRFEGITDDPTRHVNFYYQLRENKGVDQTGLTEGDATTAIFIEAALRRFYDRLERGVVDVASYSEEIQARVANRNWSDMDTELLGIRDSIWLLWATDLDSETRKEIMELTENVEEIDCELFRELLRSREGYTFTPTEHDPERIRKYDKERKQRFERYQREEGE